MTFAVMSSPTCRHEAGAGGFQHGGHDVPDGSAGWRGLEPVLVSAPYPMFLYFDSLEFRQ